MEISCPECSGVTIVDQDYPYHAGFNYCGFLYCESCPAILEFHSYNPRYRAIVGDKHPWTLTAKERKQVEDSLKPCSCGNGRFRFDALPRCPVCNDPMSDLLEDDIYFIELGEVVDADIEDAWL